MDLLALLADGITKAQLETALIVLAIIALIVWIVRR